MWGNSTGTEILQLYAVQKFSQNKLQNIIHACLQYKKMRIKWAQKICVNTEFTNIYFRKSGMSEMQLV